jgi:transposase-like protein
MKQKRRNHSPEFKARVALEAIRGVKTVQQIAADNHLHPVQVTQWKTQIMECCGLGVGRAKASMEGCGIRREIALCQLESFESESYIQPIAKY